jgi:hypothetical protein
MKGMNLTKTTLMLITSLAVVAALFAPSLSTAFSIGDDDYIDPGVVTTYQIFAGQTILVGQLNVWNDGTNICVEYVLQDGWAMAESHVDMATDQSLIPQTSRGNPIPGQFAQGDTYAELATQDIFCFAPLEGTMVIAAHAAVVHLTDGIVDQEETAWAAYEVGDMPFAGNNWATYVEY